MLTDEQARELRAKLEAIPNWPIYYAAVLRNIADYIEAGRATLTSIEITTDEREIVLRITYHTDEDQPPALVRADPPRPALTQDASNTTL
jgi:hypothetical protein